MKWPDPKRLLKKTAWAFLILAVLGTGLLVGGFTYLSRKHPDPQPWSEAFPGLFVRVWELEPDPAGRGMAIAVRFDLNSNQAKLVHRPFSLNARKRNRHFILSIADLEIRSNPACLVFLNSARYYPARPWNSLPGMAVSPIETVIDRGEPSHRHDASFLIGWTRSGDAFIETEKPPTLEGMERAWYGIGVQGIQVADHVPNYNTLANLEERMPRTLLGVDPEADIVWLIAFESISGRRMIDIAIEMGLPYAGQLDSGDATHLIFGKGLQGIPPYTGIRNVRPLAGYLAIVRIES